ncbi:hypothetical protein TUSST3_58900 [Streptomyces sp. TUS-ST3]|nr:hypothetical protein TUSST3_58900 [Streptomyces sp. TUS-ST3]
MKPTTACGPPNAATISGIVTNGPMPHIWLMLMAVAWNSPTRRTKSPLGGGLPDMGAPGVVRRDEGELRRAGRYPVLLADKVKEPYLMRQEGAPCA